MDAVLFWDMTLKEILVAIEAEQKRKLEALRQQAMIAYRQADLIACLVGILLGSKQNPPTLTETFPGIFPELERPRQQNWQLMKARIEAYAAERRKRGEKHGNDIGKIANPDHVGDVRIEKGTR
ncbi:hypothetical protein [Geobacillus kaustophilus]|uniref:hypothetical protein n=1 Tax=Geobacillus kaustophilus TaxID=1462 RepID=UPI000697339A|nr:hypothetical protein [Geobacillus kaustophilus]